MNSKPIWKAKAGGVSVALWPNEAKIGGRTVTMLKASIERRYRDSDGNWKSSNSFSRNEIPLAVYCLEKAFAEIIERSGEEEAAPEEVVE